MFFCRVSVYCLRFEVFTVGYFEYEWTIIIVTGRRITQVSTDQRESAFLFQRLSVLIQRFNAVAVHGTFALTPTDDDF